MGLKYLRKILDFLIKFADKIILGILLLILASVLMLQTEELKRTQSAVDKADEDLQRKLPTNKLDPIDESILYIETEIDRSLIWNENYGEGTLIDPGNYVYAMDGSPYILHLTTRKNPFTGKPDLPGGSQGAGSAATTPALRNGPAGGSVDTDNDGIPDDIEDNAGLNKNDSRDALQDKDNDGFDNLEEHVRKTNLADPTSRPRLATHLRFLKKVRAKLDVQLKKVNMNNEPDDKEKWDIEVKYKSGSRWKSSFLKINQMIPSTKYKIVDAVYMEKVENKIPVEVSELTLENQEGETIILPRNKVAYEGEPVYELIYMAKKPAKLKTKIGGNITLEDFLGKKEEYTLTSETEDSEELTATLVGTNESFRVDRFSPQDKKRYLKD